MRKIFFSLILVLIFAQPSFAYANLGSSSAALERQAARSSAQAKISQAADQKVTNLKLRADTEIDRRIAALNGLITRISAIKKLTDSQKSDLTLKVQTEIDSLNTLKTKIDADTDLTTLKTDVKSIVDSYRVFLVFMPQIRLLGAADRLTTLSADLTTLSGKLGERIAAAESLGKDVTQVNAWLSDLNSKAADLTAISNSITTEVLSLTPEGYPDNKSTILDARSKLKTGISDVVAVRQDALSIIKQLKEWGGTSTHGDTPTPTP